MCEMENNHDINSMEIGSEHTFNSNINPQNHVHNNDQDTNNKIMSNTGQEFMNKAANLLLQYAINIGQTAINDQKNGIKINDFVVINNNIIINHDSKNNIYTKDCMNLKDHGVVIINNHETKNDSQVDETHEAKDSFEVMDTHEVKGNQEALVTYNIADQGVNIQSNMTSIHYRCSLCENFNTESDLAAHKETHRAMLDHMNTSFVKLTPVIVFECDFCTSCFASNEILKEHQRKYYKKTILAQNRPNHDPSKPYHCKVCGWSYRQESTLKAHLVIHKPAPHVCECGVAFYRAGDLDSHRTLLSHRKPEPKPRKSTKLYNISEDSDVVIKSDAESDAGEHENQKKNKVRPQIMATLQLKQSSKGKKSSNKGNKIRPKKTSNNTTKKTTSKTTTKKTTNKTTPIKTTNKTATKKTTNKTATKKTTNKTATKKPTNNSSAKKTTRNTATKKKTNKIATKRTNIKTIANRNHISEKPIECRVNGNTVFVDRDEEGLYQCSLCDAAFQAGKHFRDHMQLKHGWSFDFMSTCEICGKTLKSSSNKKHHMLVHTGERPYSCPICNKRFTQSVVVKHHIKRIHTRERDFACSMCPKKFCEKAKMQNHERTHTGEKPYVCRTCSKPFSDRSAWKRHEVIHTGLKPHRCASCPAAFCDPASLFRHKRIHAGYRVQCTLCPRSFASTVSLTVHMQLLHSTLRERDKFQCDHCGKKFLTKTYMANHIKNMHVMPNNKLTKLKYACDICGARLRPSSMARHVATVHLRRYPHKCQQCWRRFVYMNELTRHWRQAHGPEPPGHLQCDHCRATYADKVNLIQHMAYQHLGHKCTTCKKCFNTSQCLKRHRKKGCLRCDVCNAPFTSRPKKAEHMAGHHPRKGQPMYGCDECGKRYRTMLRLLSHTRHVHKKVAKVYCCHECGASFPRRADIVNHIWDEHMVSLYCNRCLKRSFCEADFRTHKASCRMPP